MLRLYKITLCFDIEAEDKEDAINKAVEAIEAAMRFGHIDEALDIEKYDDHDEVYSS